MALDLLSPQRPRAWLRSSAALLLASALAGCAAGGRQQTTATAPAAPPVVHDLRTLADFTELFDRDREHPRIVLLLSPT